MNQYKKMEAFKERLLKELDEVSERYDALMHFMSNDEKYKELDFTNKALLQQQAMWMNGYKTTLMHHIGVSFDDDELKEFSDKYLIEYETV